MPFVNKEHREHPDNFIPGDRCFVEYKSIMERWRANPRWTTVDEIFSDLIPSPKRRAQVLALMIFFCREVIKYEEQKVKENGDV